MSVPCPVCEGDGCVPVGENFVTHDMALDACEPSMEGMGMGTEYAQCSACGGTGQIPSENEEQDSFVRYIWKCPNCGFKEPADSKHTTGFSCPVCKLTLY